MSEIYLLELTQQGPGVAGKKAIRSEEMITHQTQKETRNEDILIYLNGRLIGTVHKSTGFAGPEDTLPTLPAYEALQSKVLTPN